MEILILINITFGETRVAVVENGSVAEVYVERKSHPKTVGNIYKGRVGKVVPGMQAAFVDIGIDKSGFLSVEDVNEDSFVEFFMDEGNSPQENKKHRNLIQDMLREGQEVPVQVLKEATSGKGAKLSSYIGIPGKYVVLLGTADMVGVSKRIEDGSERNRLSNILNKFKPDATGFIARTASEGVTEDEIHKDMQHLLQLWDRITSRADSQTAPSLLYEEPELHLRAVRDLITKDVKKVMVDDREAKHDIKDYVKSRFPDFDTEIEFYSDEEPLFVRYGIETEIKKTFGKKVWLKSGGDLIIEEAEGLTVIDVNTGKYLSGKNQRETIYNINMEAAYEIARQIRLRNLVGIIVIDFIDVKNRQQREEIYNTLVEALKVDRARSVVLDMSPFGVVQMTRQRLRESLLTDLGESCEHCGGVGYIKSRETVSYEILREIKSHIVKPLARKIKVGANPAVLRSIKDLEEESLNKLEKNHEVEIVLESRDLNIDQFDIQVK